MLVDIQYYDTYYLCQVASNLLGFAYVRLTDSFLESIFYEDGKILPFEKFSLLHKYCKWVAYQVFTDDKEEDGESLAHEYMLRKSTGQWNEHSGVLYVDKVINRILNSNLDFFRWIEGRPCEMQTLSAEDYDDLRSEYLCEVLASEDFDECTDRIASEMFYVLFQNRKFLLDFNSFISRNNPFKQQRVTIPHWVKRAVFYRDRGMCVFCGKDLTGLYNNLGDRAVHYDHIISLTEMGLNDVSLLFTASTE